MDATVVAAGPEVPDCLEVGVGDTVIANIFDGLPLDLDGMWLRVVPAGKLMAVLG